MGVFDFIRDAGEKLVEKDQEEKLADRIEERIAELGLKVNGLNVEVEGGKAVIEGAPDSLENKEKAVLVAGNVKGISSVSDQMIYKGSKGEQQKEVAKTRYHTIAAGDTLSALSKKYYGDANQYMMIFKANEPMLENPDKIYPGQVLRIP